MPSISKKKRSINDSSVAQSIKIKIARTLINPKDKVKPGKASNQHQYKNFSPSPSSQHIIV